MRRYARSMFLAGERVDMQTLAQRLGVARTTLHRWAGTREAVLEEVLDGLAAEFMDAARAATQGDGEERAFDFIGQLVGMTSRFEPARAFVAREQELALRILLADSGRIRQRTADALHAVLAESLPADDTTQLDGFVDIVVQVGMALEWSAVAVGDEPSAERVITIARALLAAARAGALPTDRPTH